MDYGRADGTREQFEDNGVDVFPIAFLIYPDAPKPELT